MGAGQRFTDEFRVEAVALYRRGGRSVRRLAADLGMSPHTLENWLKQDAMKKRKKQSTGGKPPANETAEQKVERLEKELARLKRINARLEEDREILKKAAAFFAKENE